ncbi:unnamed protein product [Sphagnum troendelagicum]|uniref:DUF7748 domain-containing protein n=1 Tax=Sphagnum troendelagicum TaxID=128251 RepID=A0ABP0UL93_9BRYO
MGKLRTTIVNDTNKTLQLFEQTSSGEYTRRANLLGTRSQPNRNVTVETTESTPRLSNILGESDYFIESDPNQTYWTLSVWHGKDVVLSMSSDELIDCAVITIGWDKDKKKFTKDCPPRSNTKPTTIKPPAPAPPVAMVLDTRTGEASPAPPPHSKVSWWRSIFRRNKH